MPNEPKHAKEKRAEPGPRRNAKGDHEGSAHNPEEFDVLNPEKQGVGGEKPQQNSQRRSTAPRDRTQPCFKKEPSTISCVSPMQSSKETTMNDQDITAFWDRLSDVNAGFLSTKNGAARPVPMSHQLRDGDATIWFISARDTDLAEAAEQGGTEATYVVAEGSDGLYAVVEGKLFQNNDPALRDELWSTVADSWFEAGKDDPKACILGLVPGTAEVWLTPKSGLSFAFNIAKAQMTGKQPDVGSHGPISAAELERVRKSA